MLEQEALLYSSPSTSTRSISSFKKKLFLSPKETLKNLGIVAAGFFSGYMYWTPSFQAMSEYGIVAQYCAGLGGSITNTIFNIESYYNLFELPKFSTKPIKYILAYLLSICGVAPIFFMDIIDEKGNYIEGNALALQVATAFFNVWVRLEGTLALFDSLEELTVNKQVKQLEKKILKVEKEYQAQPVLERNESTFNYFFNDKSTEPLSKKLLKCSLKGIIGVLGVFQLSAYALVSYYGMNAFANKQFHLDKGPSIALSIIALLGNGLPGIGFTIKGLNSSCERIASCKPPSPLFWFFILPALFSGFTTLRVSSEGLKNIGYTGNFANLFCWLASIDAAIFYNLPQMAALADRVHSDKIEVIRDRGLKIATKQFARTYIKEKKNLEDGKQIFNDWMLFKSNTYRNEPIHSAIKNNYHSITSSI